MNALPYLIFPACALVAVLVIAAIQRGRPLDDRGLLLAFGGLFSLAFLVCFALLRSQWAQATLDPAAKLVTDLQAHPLMRALGDYNLDEDHAWRGAIAKEVANGRTVAEALDLARPALALMGRDRLGFADEDAHLAWADAELTALKELRQIEVSQCATLARNVGEKTGFLVLGPGMSASYAQKFEQVFCKCFPAPTPACATKASHPARKLNSIKCSNAIANYATPGCKAMAKPPSITWSASVSMRYRRMRTTADYAICASASWNRCWRSRPPWQRDCWMRRCAEGLVLGLGTRDCGAVGCYLDFPWRARIKSRAHLSETRHSS